MMNGLFNTMMTSMVADAGSDGISGLVTEVKLDPIFDAAGSLIKFSGDMLFYVVSNPILVLPLAMSVIGMGCGLIHMLRRAR